MLAEKLHGTDPEDVILDAFKEFDENNTGFIPKVFSLFLFQIKSRKYNGSHRLLEIVLAVCVRLPIANRGYVDVGDRCW